MAVASSLQFWLYRVATVARSFKNLYTLSPEKVDAFLNSYAIYDCDWADEKQFIEKLGPDYPLEVKKKLVDYYCVLNHLCAIGQIEKMYIPPAMDLSVSIMSNQVLFERQLGRDLSLAKGMKALDVGCGRGRVASHIASYTGANVVGINIDPDQLESARRFSQAKKTSCQFLHGDLNKPLEFADRSFDAVYEIQVIFSLAKDFKGVLQEIHRVLKPGGTFACLDWASLDAYESQNPHHADLLKRIKPLIGAIGTRSAAECAEMLQEVGFKIVKNENASIDGMQAPLIENADKFFTRVTKLIHFCTKWKILPLHFRTLFDRLTKDGDAFIEADRLRLVTSSHYIVAKKA